MSVRGHYLGLVLLLIIATGAVLAASAIVRAQDHSRMDHAQHMRGAGAVVPTHPGQEAFGTIQEVVHILEADPKTDWSKVNIGADEVTLRARSNERLLNNGIEITITGEGRTLAAIQRMVPAHTRELVAIGWSASTQDLPDGVKLVVTSSDPRDVVKLKALGFLGLMVQGAHHQPHHLMMAKGEFAH